MKVPGPVIVSAAVEGIVDEAVVRNLVAGVDAEVAGIHGKNGKPYLRKKIGAFNNAARHAPWLVLVDLNGDADCAPTAFGCQRGDRRVRIAAASAPISAAPAIAR